MWNLDEQGHEEFILSAIVLIGGLLLVILW